MDAIDDATKHPAIELPHWARAHLTPQQRAAATVCASGEHCPMRSAAHGRLGLGRIGYVHSAAQLADWLAELNVPAGPVRCLPIEDVVPALPVQGPAPGLADRMRELHHRFQAMRRTGPQAAG
ncbi:hypothetical protein [Streptomyces sp. NPDC053560]|uniref:hypothetical protein n=1 Tax=Streptomyces sp. NPDC053560 TaxID=3365711 RepID=UPI0037D121D3